MVCHSQELKRVRFIKEPSEDNPKTTERVVRLTDAALSLTEPVIVCFIPYLEELLDTIASSSSNTSQWT